MSIVSAFRKDIMDDKITELGIYLDEDVNWTNEALIKRLGDYYLEHANREVTWGEKYIHSLNTVMLCNHLKDRRHMFTDKTDPMVSDDYVAEFKCNGFRFVGVYDPFQGWGFFSRKESVENYLNGDFSNKVLFIKDGLIKNPQQYKGAMPFRFVVDGEITVDSTDANFEGIEYESIEDYVQAILGSSAERAKNFQKDGHKLVFNIFDVLYFEKNPTETSYPEVHFNYKGKPNPTVQQIEEVEAVYGEYLESAGFKIGKKKTTAKELYEYLYDLIHNSNKNDLRRRPFSTRRKIRTQLVAAMNKVGIPMKEVEGEDFDKVGYLEHVLNSGFEGIICKNIHAPYISTLRSSRSHNACLKVKQSLDKIMENMDLVEDFDVFIVGANPPKSDRIKDMIGALKCCIYLRKEDGTEVMHEICNVTGITHEWKRKFAKIDEETGEITLNPEYYGKVIAVNGMALTGSNLKFQHAVLRDKDAIEFKAKNPTECVWDESALREMVLVRGR